MSRETLTMGAVVAGVLFVFAVWLISTGEFDYQRGRWAEGDDNPSQAIRSYHNATAQGHERAGRAFDRLCPVPPILPRRSVAARNWCLHVATFHDETSAYRIVGRQALAGDGMPKDVAFGLALLEAAVRGGDAGACEVLALAYFGFEPVKGLVSENPERALNWLKEGAKLGDLWALDYLYRIYYEGRLVPKDRAEYTKWLLLSVAYGDRELEGFVRQVYRYDLTPADIAEAERRAKEWLDRYPPRKVYRG